LPLTERFFQRRKTIILDRDGVLNQRPRRAHYVRSWAEFFWIPGARSALRLLAENDYRVIVVSNQAGIARRVMTEADLNDIHDRMKQDVERSGGHIDAIYYCAHDWDSGCDCRKPKPGMLFQAQRDFDLDLTRTIFAGDDERDAEAAAEAGCRFGAISEDCPLIQYVNELFEHDRTKKNEENEAATIIDHRA
jgi:D-glycero-D-manno-heptose 1,7-bisphosphate phosphatase